MNLESKRVEELRSYLMLDTPKDIDLDELTKIASLVCDTPIALISLVDENRQWFKSKVHNSLNPNGDFGQSDR
jgi:hypothetical protein